MTTQATPDYNAELERQRKATESAQALARDWQGVADRQRDELAAADAAHKMSEARVSELKAERRALCDLLSADTSTVAGQTLVEAARAVLDELSELRAIAALAVERCTALEARIAQSEEGQTDPAPLGICPRCGNPLNNVSPGTSIVAGGVSVCTSCLNPGETEIARARSL